MNAKQIEAVLALEAPARVRHFIKVVADREEAWGLYDDGWASSGTDDGAIAFPLWPAREYAQLCALNEWSTYSPRVIALDELSDALIPMLQKQGVLLAVFQTPAGNGATVTPDQLSAMLEAELEQY